MTALFFDAFALMPEPVCGKSKGSVPVFRCSARSDAGLYPDGVGDGFARIEGFLRVLGLDAAVAVAEFLEIATSLLKHAARDAAEPFEAVVVRGGWVGVHGAVSRSIVPTSKERTAIDNLEWKSEPRFMSATISAPEPWVRSVGDLRLPPQADERLQELMDRNNEGLLGGTERAELAALAEWSETVSLLRAEALQLLGRVPA